MSSWTCPQGQAWPANTKRAGPVIHTRSAVRRIVSGPPGSWTRTGWSAGARPWATAAARVAQAPVPPAPVGVPDLIKELAELGTGAAVVMTAGMNPEQKQAMLAAARPHLLRILGPNCLGLLAPHKGLNASFAHTDARAGELAFVSQSGALVTAMLDWAGDRSIGFSHCVSLGEHGDVDFGDMLDWLASDARTRAILLYIESVTAPRKFMSAARAAARNKPVLVVKAGRSPQGQAAAASHTGALAGSDLVYDAAIRRAGMLRVDTLQDLFTCLGCSSQSPLTMQFSVDSTLLVESILR